MNFFCNLPFNEIIVQDNNAKPCCVFRSDQPISVKEYLTSTEIISVKKQLLEGIAPSQCSVCVHSEKKTGHSFRLVNKNFNQDETDNIKQLNDPTYFNIKNLIITTSNICNLKCLPCENSSYVRDLERFKLGLSNHIPIVNRITNFDFVTGLDIERITLLGGEPFYDQVSFDFLKVLVKTGQSKKLQIDLNTNMTSITKDKLEFLTTNFKKVLIKASIDGLGGVNDYLRYPSQWGTIINNIKTVQSYPTVDLFVTTALSNLALLRFYEVIEWAATENLNLFITTVESPDVLNPNLLPSDIKKQLLPKYQYLKTNLSGKIRNRTEYCIDSCIHICSDLTIDTNKWNEFQTWIKKHDALRNNSCIKIFPELVDYV
jgi:hypothetical protein